MSHIPWPREGFLVDQIALGVPEGRKRWRNHAGDRYYEWDTQHGHIEVYNKTGRHIAVFDKDGMWIGDAVRGRRIHV